MADGESAWVAALLNASGTAMLGVDLEGRTTFWSAGAEALFGWQLDEVMGREPPIVPAPLKQEWQLQMQHVFRTGEPTPAAETERLTRDGRTVWVVRSSAPVRDEHGKVIGLADALTDVTALKQLDEETRALTQVRERELVAMDLHDGLIQSLYGVVLNLAAQERAVGASRADVAEALKAGRREVERVIEETRSYVFNLRARQFSPRNLSTGLQLLADGLRLNGDLAVSLNVDPEAEGLLQPEARGHVLYLIREAASNVLRHAEAHSVMIEVARSDAGLLVQVIDDGRGFTPSERRTDRHRA